MCRVMVTKEYLTEGIYKTGCGTNRWVEVTDGFICHEHAHATTTPEPQLETPKKDVDTKTFASR